MLIDTLMGSISTVPVEDWHWITPWLTGLHYVVSAGLIVAVVRGLWRRKR